MGNNDWIIGVSFSFASSVLSCLGLIFQKYAHNQNQMLPDDKKYPVIAGIVCSPCWWASFIMMGLFPFPFDFFAYSFAAQSLVAPFAGLTLIMNQFFAPLILKEKLYRIDVYASIVVFIGTTLTTVTGNHDDESYSLDDLLGYFRETAFIVGAVLLLTIMSFMIVSLRMTDPLRTDNQQKSNNGGDDVERGDQGSDGEASLASQDCEDEGVAPNRMPSSPKEVEVIFSDDQPRKEEVSSGADSFNSSMMEASGAQNAGDGEKEVLASTTMALTGIRREKGLGGFLSYANFAARPFYYGFVSGAFGALQNIFFKSVGVLMKSSVFDGGESAWVTPYPYIFLLVVVVLALSQLSFLNKGMSRYDAVLVFPLYNACYIFLSVSMGALYYGEFDTFSTTQWVLFPLGVLITIVGIVLFIFKPRETISEAGKTAQEQQKTTVEKSTRNADTLDVDVEQTTANTAEAPSTNDQSMVSL